MTHLALVHAEPRDRNRGLRQELQDAQASRKAADAAAAVANRMLSQAAELVCEAAQRCQRLKTELTERTPPRRIPAPTPS